MTTYNTGNALGSTDPRDLYDNSKVFDELVNNTTDPTVQDRFGNTRITLANQLGYNFKGDYAAGIELISYTDIIRYNSEFYRPSASAALPYTTTATLPDADSNLVPVGDANLRQELALPSATTGSDLVAHTGTTDTVTQALNKRTIYVGSVAELSGLTPLGGGQQASVAGDNPAMYEWNAGDYTTSIDGFEVVAWSGDTAPGAAGAWLLFDRVVTKQYASQYLQTTSDILNFKPVDATRFIPKNLHSGIKDYTATTDVSSYLQAANDALEGPGGKIMLPRGRYPMAGQVTFGNWIGIYGEGSRTSQLFALPEFAGSDTMLRFQNGTSSMFNSRIEDIWIRVEGVAAVKQAIIADAWQETSGARRLTINGLDGSDKRGILIQNGFGGAAYLRLDDIEIFGAGYSAGIDCQQISSVGSFVLHINGMTATGTNDTTGMSSNGIRMANDTLVCDGFHAEYMINGIRFDGGSRGHVRGSTGSFSRVDNLISLASEWTGDLSADMLIPNGASYTIFDGITGAHKTGVISNYSYRASESPSNAKAWVIFDGTNGVIKDSMGIASVTKNSTGNYDVTFDNAFPDTNYVANVSHNATNQRVALHRESGKAAAFYAFQTQEWVGVSASDAVTIDPTDVRVTFYANRA